MIQIKESARAELLRLRPGLEPFLRIAVVPGGCSGFTYQLGFDSVQTPFDKVVYEDPELKVLTDSKSLSCIEGLSIDYSNDLIKAGFRFANPNAMSVCGCGSSFSR